MNIPQGVVLADTTWLSATKCKILSTGRINNNQDQERAHDDWATQHLELPTDVGLRFILAVQENKGQT